LSGGFALKKHKEKKGSRILRVKDEKEFYTLIEERLEKQGFQLFKTSPSVSRDVEYGRFF
jgi:pimeloyl-CoA synthetase